MKQGLPAPLAALAALLAIYLIAPFAAGIRQLGLADWSSVDTTALLDAAAVSAASATVATFLIAICGVPLGYFLARRSGRAMALLGFCVQLPLALPPLASGVLLLFLVGYSSPLGRLTAGALTDSFAGIVACQVFVAAPFLIIAASSAFAACDPILEGVAGTLGRKPLYVFFKVSVPIAAPAIVSGLLLAWLRAFGEFGATVMVAYHPYSLPVYTYVTFGSEGLPAMLPVLLPTLAVAVIVMLLSVLVSRPVHVRSKPPATVQNLPAIAFGPGRLDPNPAGPARLDIHLKRRLGAFALDVPWSSRHRRMAIVGPSGSGKSLMLKLIAGIEPADGSLVIINGKDVSASGPAARGTAYVPQNYGLFPHLAVVDQLAFPAGADPALARLYIGRLGLAGLEQRKPGELSLGQQQRVAIARALLRPAALLLLDEPFSALDTPLRASLRRDMLQLQNQLGMMTVLVTHDPTDAALLSDELLVIENGRVLQCGPTNDVFSRPASETVARLLGADFVAEGLAIGPETIAVGDGVELKVAGAPLVPGTTVGWSAPAGAIRVLEQGRYAGVVEDVFPSGVTLQVVVRVGKAMLTTGTTNKDLRVGKPCRVDIEPTEVRVWPLDRS